MITTQEAAPKVELHCHLDGSVGLAAMKEILTLEKRVPPSGEGLKKKMMVPDSITSLAEYLACFDYVLSYLQNEEALTIAAYDVVRQAALENVRYIEIRFAPLLFCRQGLTPSQAVEAVLKGFRQAGQKFQIKAQGILCMMRHLSEEENVQVLTLAETYAGQGICAVDLAGDEAAYPMEQFVGLFQRAQERRIPFTIHAGECGRAENIRLAIALGAKRIGHGIAAIKDREVMDLCREKEVLLEVCPSCNVQTKAVAELSDHPLPQLAASGLKVCLNTDNRTISNLTLSEEYRRAAQVYGYSPRDMQQFTRNALDGAFIDENTKKLIRKELA